MEIGGTNRQSWMGLGRALRAGLVILMVAALPVGCTFDKGELGTEKNPIKLFFVPSVESQTIRDSSAEIKRYLEESTPYHFEVRIPESYVAVVEAFGANRVDVAALNTFGYVLAHERFGAQALLTVIRHGRSTYRSAFYTREGGKIKKLEDLEGKSVAFVDPASASGYMLPMKELKDREIQTGNNIFAMTHDAVISMIYQGRVEAGAAYYSPPEEGEIQDARKLVRAQYPDVTNKVQILHLTSDIPNEPVVFRKDMPEEIKEAVVAALLELTKDEKGSQALQDLFGITELKRSSDEEYAPVIKMLSELGESSTDLAQPSDKKKK